jgi:hypothetical protein
MASTSAISRRSVSYRIAATRCPSERIPYRRNVWRLEMTAARMLVEPTHTRTVVETLASWREAKTLVPTIVVRTTTGTPRKRYRCRILSAMRR